MPILTFFTSPIGRIALVALLAAGAFGYGYFLGGNHADRDHEAARAVELQQFIEELDRETQRADKISSAFSQWKRTHSTKRSGYVLGAGRLSGCSALPAEFVRLYDASGSAEALPEATSSIACATSTVPADRAAIIVAENNANCAELRAQLDALIDFHEGK
jgi:hypothetical protein